MAVNSESDSDSEDDQTIEENVVETLCNELSNIDNEWKLCFGKNRKDIL